MRDKDKTLEFYGDDDHVDYQDINECLGYTIVKIQRDAELCDEQVAGEDVMYKTTLTLQNWNTQETKKYVTQLQRFFFWNITKHPEYMEHDGFECLKQLYEAAVYAKNKEEAG